MRFSLAAIAATSLVAVVGIAAAQTLTSPAPTIAIKPVISGAAIIAVTPIAPCGQTLKVPVTIKAGTVPAQGTIVVGGATRFTAPYNVPAGSTMTVSVSTTAVVTCTASGATVPNAAVWLEPTTGGSDAMMWTLRPTAVTYSATKSSIPG